MKDTNMDKLDSLSDKPKRKNQKTIKSKDTPLVIPESGADPALIETTEAMRQTVENIIKNSVNQYADIAEKQLKETRDDFDALQPIISEFLDEFMLIGHTLEGQRVVMRYTSTQADADKLSELCKKVLVRMMIQEQSGQ